MAMDGDILFSVITPSAGNRPKALQKAVHSVEQAARFAGLEKGQIEILIGFDGVKGQCPESAYPVRCFNLPKDNDWGNGIRNTLLQIAGGSKLIFLDDDNIIQPYTLQHYLKHFDAEMIIGRIDTQLAFDKPYLPVGNAGSVVRQGNIDPLCLCVSRSLVVDRCGGWGHQGNHEGAYLNILDWHRRTHSVTVIEEIVGVYDAGRSLDSGALSRRQVTLLDNLASKRGIEPTAMGRPMVPTLAAQPV